MKILSEFLHGFELEKLHPNSSCVKRAPGLITYVLSDESNAYAVFLSATGTRKTSLELETDEGNCMIQTVNTITGLYSEPSILTSKDGIITIEIEIPDGELALKIVRE